MSVRVALVLALVSVASPSLADDAPTLRLKREPPPRHLRMRPRAAAAAKPAPAATAAPGVTTSGTAPAESTNPYSQSADAGGFVRDLNRPTSVRFSMGYVVDGASLTGKPTHGGRTVEDYDFRRLRAYALGEGTFSSRGVLLPSLSTYLSTSFQIASQQFEANPTSMRPAQERAVAPPVATWFDRSGVQNRSIWAEVKDFVPDRRLAPLRFRAGQLYVYGPWVLHMYGGMLAWDGKLTQLSVYAGSRVPDYTLVEVTKQDRSGIFGTSARFDLRALKRPIPAAFGFELLQFTARGAATDRASSHGTLQADWRPRNDVALIGLARVLDGKLANEHVQLRSRYKQVTNLVFDFTYRHDTDWRWDPSVGNQDPLAARRYLDLGPVVPQMMMSGRAGTLIAENIDVLVRGAIASDRVKTEEQRSTFAPAFAEIGGGLEVRLRRTVAMGFSGLSRQTKRYATVSGQIQDMSGLPQPLPRPYSPDIGERGFTELGTQLRMSLGARRFSALVEGYGRRTRYSLAYCAVDDATGMCPPIEDGVRETGILDTDYRFGARVTIDAWIGNRLRMFAAYELSSRIDVAPEISGFKSLRLMMEGVY
jgi:hypothetical protein